MTYDVFISHSTKNKSTADAVCRTLEQNGIRCWIAPRNIAGGFNYGAEIIKGLNKCSALVLVFSSHSNTSPAVWREVQYAFAQQKTIIPLRIEDVAVSDDLVFFLSGVQWLDALPDQQVYENLLWSVSRVLGKKEEKVTRRVAPVGIRAEKTVPFPPEEMMPSVGAGLFQAVGDYFHNVFCSADKQEPPAESGEMLYASMGAEAENFFGFINIGYGATIRTKPDLRSPLHPRGSLFARKNAFVQVVRSLLGSDNAHWYEVIFGGGDKGWIRAAHVTRKEAAQESWDGFINRNYVAFGPYPEAWTNTTVSNVSRRLREGAPVKVIASITNIDGERWLYVEYDDGKGWVRGDFVNTPQQWQRQTERGQRLLQEHADDSEMRRIRSQAPPSSMSMPTQIKRPRW